LFLVGCTVGQRLALVPLSGSDNLVSLDEFLQAIYRLGLSNNDSVRKICDAMKKLTLSDDSSDSKAIGDFIEGMASLAHDVRENQSEESFNWFYIGNLLFEIATFPVVDHDLVLENHNIAKLYTLVERIKLPERLRGGIIRFCSVATETQPVVLIGYAQEIASVIYSTI
jgi:hypothetical protein